MNRCDIAHTNFPSRAAAFDRTAKATAIAPARTTATPTTHKVP